MKVRIGNDIRLRVKLAKGLFFANILSMLAIFINATLKEKLDAEYKNKNRFIGRFPIEPFVDEFLPTAYNINSGGYPKYSTFVFNEYSGFGINPDWHKCFPISEENITEYRSDIERTEDPEEVIVTFPADAQLYAGKYDLVITAQIYDTGYSNNSRTVSANYKNVFELTEDSQIDSPDNPVQIQIS